MIILSFLDDMGFYLYNSLVAEGVYYTNSVQSIPPSTSLEQGKQWRFVGGQWMQEVKFAPEAVVNHGTKITKLAFLNRLGDTVLGAIEAASRSNNALGYAAAVIKIKHASSAYIDLSLPETQADVQKLVDYGFIDSTRKDEVLNNPVQEKEVPLFQ